MHFDALETYKKIYLIGLYIFGSVGEGKTMLMDLFFDCCTKIPKKSRVHFNSFMVDVHKQIHQVKQNLAAAGEKTRSYDPIKPVAESIAAKTWLICFDEFQVGCPLFRPKSI